MPFVADMPTLRRDGNAGLVTTTGGGAGFEDTLHTMPTGRSARITKIFIWNDSGAVVDVLIGTMDRNPAGATFVQLLPTISALNAIENTWTETEIPAVEWVSDTTATAAGRTGNIVVQTAGVGLLVAIEVEEKL